MNLISITHYILLFYICVLPSLLATDISKSEQDSEQPIKRDVKMKGPRITSQRRRKEYEEKKRRQPKDAVDLTYQLMAGYKKQEPPLKAFPTEVRLGIYVVSFYSVSESTMDYSVSMYLRQNWRDPRLVYEPLDGKITSIRLHDDSWDKLWMPDVFFRNEKRASYHEITVANRLLRLNATGFLW